MITKYFKFFFLTFFLMANAIYASEEQNITNKWSNEIKGLIFDEDRKILDGSNLFNLVTPYRAMDAAVVPIEINFNFFQKEDKYVKSVVLVVDENPAPIVGKFNFTLKTGNASFSTRIRVDRYTYVRAIVEMNDGNLYMNSNYVKAAGGCSAPSLADMDSVMARLGKMKMNFIKTGPIGSINKAKLLISHPNYSGLQFNQLTRSEIPSHFVNMIEIHQDDELIFSASPDISLSEDPAIIFNYLDSGGLIQVNVVDSEGLNFSNKYSSTKKKFTSKD